MLFESYALQNGNTIKFLDEIEQVCKKHNRSFSHEDSQGAFIIEDFNEDNIEWLKAAWDKSENFVEPY